MDSEDDDNKPGSEGSETFDALLRDIARSDSTEPPGTDLTNSTFGDYRVAALIARGGMGIVYRATDSRLGRDVALKVLPRSFADDQDRRRRFLREARSAASINHANIATIYEVGEVDGRLFLAMERIDGTTLRARLTADGLGQAEALRLARQIAAGLASAHEKGIVHRDLKPENVMITRDGNAKILDFGLAKVRQPAADEAAPPQSGRSALTQEGRVMGTPGYMSPEQATAQSVDERTDVYAFGVVLHEMITGELPGAHGSGRVAPDPAVAAIITRCLARAPENRLANGAAVVAALDALERTSRATTGDTVRPSGRAFPRWTNAGRGRRALAVSGVVAVAGLVVGVVAVRGARHGAAARPPPLADPVSVLMAPGARVACPIFEVHGITDADVAATLGAAAADLACEKNAWYWNTSSAASLPPSALLDVPTEPVESYPDPYAVPGQREHTLAIARVRANVYTDGVVTHDASGWFVTVVLRTSDGRDIARGEGRDPVDLVNAVRRSIETLWKTPSLVPRPIDEVTAYWTGAKDPEVAIASEEMVEADNCADQCRILAHRAPLLMPPDSSCQPIVEEEGLDGGTPGLDESSPPALLYSAVRFERSLPAEQLRAAAVKLEEIRDHEPSSIGRTKLGEGLGRVWTQLREPDRARTDLLRALRETPRSHVAWLFLRYAQADITSAPSLANVAAALFPADPTFLLHATSIRKDELDARLHDGHLGVLLSAAIKEYAYFFGRALIEAGRINEARVLAANPGPYLVGDQARMLESYLLAFIDLQGGRLAAGAEKLLALPSTGEDELLAVANVLGTTDDVATRWANRFLAASEEDARPGVNRGIGPIALCMHARRAIATRCLARVNLLVGTRQESGPRYTRAQHDFIDGAEFYVRGDMRGAVKQWRRLLASPKDFALRNLPVDAFERGGEPELAASIDAVTLRYGFIAGVSEAAPREAARALAAGDYARARELASQVVARWATADAPVPAVPQMRALLASLPRE